MSTPTPAPAVIIDRTPDSEGPSSHSTEPGAHVDNLAERKSALVAELRYLESLANRRSGGAPLLTPKQRLLDTTPIEAAHPDNAYRFVNIATPGKADDRIREGWTRTSEEDAKAAGVRASLGNDFALMQTSRAVRDKRIADRDALHRSRIESQRTGMAEVAESVARELRDRHNIRIDAKRLFEER